jgi:hypothetical protein
LGYTNIFPIVHHKTDEITEHINQFLDDEEAEHLAYFPRGIRTVDVVSMTPSKKSIAKRSNQGTTASSYAISDEEMIERLVLMQD